MDDFSVDYDPTSVDDIKDIHIYLMKNNMIWYDKYVQKQKTIVKK